MQRLINLCAYLFSLMQIRLRAAVFIVEKNKLLVVHHNFSDSDYWLIPGGTLSPGEPIEVEAVGKVKIETGLDILIERFLFTREYFSGNSHFVEFYFLGSLSPPHQTPVVDSSVAPSVVEVKFLSFEELSSVKFFPLFIKEQLSTFIHSDFKDVEPYLGLKE